MEETVCAKQLCKIEKNTSKLNHTVLFNIDQNDLEITKCFNMKEASGLNEQMTTNKLQSSISSECRDTENNSKIICANLIDTTSLNASNNEQDHVEITYCHPATFQNNKEKETPVSSSLHIEDANDMECTKCIMPDPKDLKITERDFSSNFKQFSNNAELPLTEDVPMNTPSVDIEQKSTQKPSIEELNLSTSSKPLCPDMTFTECLPAQTIDKTSKALSTVITNISNCVPVNTELNCDDNMEVCTVHKALSCISSYSRLNTKNESVSVNRDIEMVSVSDERNSTESKLSKHLSTSFSSASNSHKFSSPAKPVLPETQVVSCLACKPIDFDQVSCAGPLQPSTSTSKHLPTKHRNVPVSISSFHYSATKNNTCNAFSPSNDSTNNSSLMPMEFSSVNDSFNADLIKNIDIFSPSSRVEIANNQLSPETAPLLSQI